MSDASTNSSLNGASVSGNANNYSGNSSDSSSSSSSSGPPSPPQIPTSLFALQQQRPGGDSANSAIKALKEKKHRKDAVALLEAKKMRKSSRSLLTTRAMTSMEELLRGGSVPTKLNNLSSSCDDDNEESKCCYSQPSSDKKIRRSNCGDIPRVVVSTTSSSPLPARPKTEGECIRVPNEGLLSVTGRPRIQFPSHFAPDEGDVVVGVEMECEGIAINANFQELICHAVPAFREALARKQGKAIQGIVHSVIREISQLNGYFVTPVVAVGVHGEFQGWVEVNRNIAERFTLYELRSALAAFQKVISQQQAQLQHQVTTTISTNARAINIAARTVTEDDGKKPRRVSPPDMQAAAQVAERPGDSDDDTVSCASIVYSQVVSKKKAPPDASCSKDEESSSDALLLLSEAAFKLSPRSDRTEDGSSSKKRRFEHEVSSSMALPESKTAKISSN